MDNDHGITDELRTYIDGLMLVPLTCSKLTAIADRIDEEHKKAMIRAGQLLDDAEKERDYNYANWQDCKQKVLQHSVTINELSAEIERLKDELAHRIEPPKDADGEYWLYGDKIMMPDGNVVEVVGIGGDWLYYCVASVAITAFYRTRAHDKRHYKQPTVEDVLWDMHVKLDEVAALHADEPTDSDERERDVERILAEHAAKLQLRGDA